MYNIVLHVFIYAFLLSLVLCDLGSINNDRHQAYSVCLNMCNYAQEASIQMRQSVFAINLLILSYCHLIDVSFIKIILPGKLEFSVYVCNFNGRTTYDLFLLHIYYSAQMRI